MIFAPLPKDGVKTMPFLFKNEALRFAKATTYYLATLKKQATLYNLTEPYASK